MDITIKFSGTAGQGIQTIGDVLTNTAASTGIHVLNFRSYGAEIRARGNSDATVRLSNTPVSSFTDDIDVLVSTQRNASIVWASAVKQDSIIIFDNDPKQVFDEKDSFLAKLPPGVTLCGVPLTLFSQEITGASKGKNIAALGALIYVLDIPLESCEAEIARFWKRKGDLFVKNNCAILRKAYEYCQTEYLTESYRKKIKVTGKGFPVLSGNQAVAKGALAAKCSIYAGYPITPATPIFEMLAKELPAQKGKVIQTEDEISAISVVLGASFTGARSMTATSGPGFSLMIEQIGLSSMAEVPCVIVCVQRGGPSTGLPTKTEQSDLNIALYGGHGDTTRIILAPTNVSECYSCAIKAFDYAQRYQMPVILLSDFFLANRRETIHETFKKPKKTDTLVKPKSSTQKSFKRFKNTKNGISPMPIPGTEGFYYTTTGLEHNESGTPVYDPENHLAQTDKRFRKLKTALQEINDAEIIGDPKAKIGIVSWGSTTGAVLEAMSLAQSKGISIKVLKTTVLWPLPENSIKELFSSVEKVLIPEMNYQGQLASLLTFVEADKIIRFNVISGIPLTSIDIMQQIEKVNDVLRKE